MTATDGGCRPTEMQILQEQKFARRMEKDFVSVRLQAGSYKESALSKIG
ncbi:hypothetical protein [Microbulbifer rhizosphaerae]|uniref:Uncharacterized protein n=1 Tax=Microbulbifer rhizosphaerae TaxID=1562603 RepID=A0A7W4WAW7_9GAMM|nr:hypothetical protein [Microbulbifer rhizosphaerae]MBB3060888.1 hypothetical protein [Microbulbifer rhizosphaerae]